uniref:Uncharacterized protein n=1 Tax=Anguilla anguilla TaxID=7936 RepID=A0A0E9QPX4_ANGAN
MGSLSRLPTVIGCRWA